MLHMAGEQIFFVIDGWKGSKRSNKSNFAFAVKYVWKNLVSIKLHELHSAHAGCRQNVIRSLSYLYSRRNVSSFFSRLNLSLSYRCCLRARFFFIIWYSVVAIYIY